jgi:hypothetical protein
MFRHPMRLALLPLVVLAFAPASHSAPLEPKRRNPAVLAPVEFQADTALASAEGFTPPGGTRRTCTTAHQRVVQYGRLIVDAMERAVYRPIQDNELWVRDDASAAEVAHNWALTYNLLLCRSDVITHNGDRMRPGPQWHTFREKFLTRAVHDPAEDLLVQARREVAPLAREAAPSPRERLVIDLESNSLTLDGDPFQDLDPTGLRIIAALQAALRSGAPIMSAKTISGQVPGCHGGPKAVSRCLHRLPEEIQALVRAERGKGHRLQLPPRN